MNFKLWIKPREFEIYTLSIKYTRSVFLSYFPSVWNKTKSMLLKLSFHFSHCSNFPLKLYSCTFKSSILINFYSSSFKLSTNISHFSNPCFLFYFLFFFYLWCMQFINILKLWYIMMHSIEMCCLFAFNKTWLEFESFEVMVRSCWHAARVR